ncbi:MAG: hypothetical protein F6K21_08110 [Symploca sp. SIO2D2]|nr:hypothetical protein [Symploca sp. SIO2D2]
MKSAAQNQEALAEIKRLLRMSQGDCSLVLAVGNYACLREQIIEELCRESPVAIRKLSLTEEVESLHSAIVEEIGEELPEALFICGLESLTNLDEVLSNTNYLREEFHQFQFPLIFWVTDAIVSKFIRSAQDFYTWTTTIEFAITIEELIDFLRQTSDEVFNHILNSEDAFLFTANQTRLGLTASRCRELEQASQELQQADLTLEPELDASLAFVLGRWTNDQVLARQYYEDSLNLYPETGNPDKKGLIHLHLGLWWRSYAVQQRREYEEACQRARDYFEEAIALFEKAQLEDLVSTFINYWAEVLHRLAQWQELGQVANQALPLHQSRGDLFCQARSHGFLAEVALAKAEPQIAQQQAREALTLFSQGEKALNPSLQEENAAIRLDWERKFHQGWYLFSLAKAQQKLGDIPAARETLIKAKQITEPHYDPALYIGILKTLREIYFQQEQYLTAFELKQERQTVETQFGFRAFIGAGRLQAKQLVTNPALPTAVSPGEVSLEIKASGRGQDINKLLGRIELSGGRLRSDCRLMIIHGQSGVGKSSLIEAGLIPALQQKIVGTRRILPVLQRVYTDWVKELERCLLQAEAVVGNSREQDVNNSREQDAPTTNLPISDFLGKSRKGEALAEQNSDAMGNMPAPMLLPYSQLSTSFSDTATPILDQLRKNSDRNLLTVLIFDQFEEFFFVYKDPKQRKVFYEFLRYCLNIPFVTVILSLREDYLYYLLECNNRLVNLDIANNDILNKNILNYLGNFDPKAAKLIIQELTGQTQFSLEPELLDTLVKDLAGDLGEVSPIELQIVGAQLQAEKITKLADYQQLGSKEQLVGRFLDDVVKDCGQGNEQLAKLVLYLLTDENNTRPLKTRADLELELEVKGETLSLVLDILVKSGLILRVPANPADRYQLVHDYLVTFVRQGQSERLIKELEKEREKRKITEKQLNEVLKKQLKTARRSTVVLSLVATAVTGVAIIAVTAALNGFAAVLANQVTGGGIEKKINYIKAGKLLKLAPWQIPDANIFTLLSLQRAIYDNEEANRLQGHTESVTDVAFSKNKKYIASASVDKTVRLWTVDGKDIVILKGHKEVINDVEFSPDSKIIASASDDTTIKLWNIDDATILRSFTEHKGKVDKIRFSEDGQTIVSLTKDNVAIFWNLENDKFKQLDHTEIYDFDFGHFTQDFFVVTTDIDGNKHFWDKKGDLIRKELEEKDTSQQDTIIVSPTHVTNDSLQEKYFLSSFGLNARIESSSNYISLFSPNKRFFNGYELMLTSHLEFSPNAQKIAALIEPIGAIGIWQNDGKSIKTIIESTSDIAFNPSNNHLASVSIGNTLNIWSADSKQIETIQSDTIINNIKYSVDGELVGASTGNSVKIWKKDGFLLKKFPDKTTVQFSPDNQLVAVGNSKNIEIWQRNGNLFKIFKEFADKTTVRFSYDSKLIAVGNDEKIEIWQRDGKIFKEFADKTTVKFSPDNQLIAVDNHRRRNSRLEIWKRDKTLLTEFDETENITFNIDNQFIVIQKFNQVEIWQYNNQLRKIKTFQRYKSAQISSDGKLIVTTDKNGIIKIWKYNGILVKTIKENISNITARDVFISPDSNIIAIVFNKTNEDIIKIWNKDGILLKELKGNYKSYINNPVFFSYDGKLIAIVSNDNVVKILNSNGLLVEKLEYSDIKFGFISNSYDIAFTSYHSNIKIWNNNSNLLKTFTTYNNKIHAIAFSPSGKLIVSASDDGKIQLWKYDGTLLKNIAAHSKKVNSVNFSPNGKLVVSGSDDKTIKLWKVNGTLIKTFKGHTKKVNDVKFNPKGNLIASASDEHTVKLWRLNGSLDKDLKIDGIASTINFSNDGKVLAISQHSQVNFWLIEGMFAKYVNFNYSRSRALSFSPDGKAIAVATDEGLLLKSFELDKLLQKGCDQIRGYLKNNPNVKERDRKLCDDIGTKE